MNKAYIKNLAAKLIDRPPYRAEGTLHHLRKKDELVGETLLQEMLKQIRLRNSSESGSILEHLQG